MRNPYGRPHARAVAALLADNPPCIWCGIPADSGDHWPPLKVFGGDPDRWEESGGMLLPSCIGCNKGQKAQRAYDGKIAMPKLPKRIAAETQAVQFEAERLQLVAMWSRKVSEAAESDDVSMRTLNDLARLYRLFAADAREQRPADAQTKAKPIDERLRRMIERRK